MKSPLGPKNATTAHTTGLRTYRWQGKDYPSVTSLRRIAGMPFGLANWQVGQVLEAAVKNSSVLDSMVAAEGEDVARKWLRKEAMLTRDTAASRGSLVHEAASLDLPRALLDAEIAPYVEQYDHFLTATKAKVLLSERQVFSDKYGYGGSVDLVLSMPDKEAPDGARVVVADIKTGKGLYADHALQLLAYTLADFVGEDDVVDREATAILHKATRMAVVHVSDVDWEFVEFAPTPSLVAAHEALVEFAHWLIDNPTVETLVNRRIYK